MDLPLSSANKYSDRFPGMNAVYLKLKIYILEYLLGGWTCISNLNVVLLMKSSFLTASAFD